MLFILVADDYTVCLTNKKRERERENAMCDFDFFCEDRTWRGDSYIASLTCGDEICILIRINTCQQCHLQ